MDLKDVSRPEGFASNLGRGQNVITASAQGVIISQVSPKELQVRGYSVKQRVAGAFHAQSAQTHPCWCSYAPHR